MSAPRRTRQRSRRPATRRRLAVWVSGCALALSVSLTAPLAAQASPTLSRCGNIAHQGAGIYDVRKYGVSCGGARRFAKYAFRHYCSHSRCNIHGFICHSKTLGEELWVIRCTRTRKSGVKIVRFLFGA